MFIRMIGKAFLRQWKKMAMIAFTIALGASLATAMLSVMLDVGDKVNQELKAYGANINVVPKDASVISSLYDVGDENISGAYLREDELGKIKTIFWAFNIVDYAPFITAQASLDSGDTVNVKGTWFNHHMELPTGEQLDAGVASMRSWWGITEGDWLDEQKQEGTGYAMVGTDVAKKENIHAGDTIHLKGTASELDVQVVGVFDSGGEEDGEIFVPLDTAQALGGLDGKVDSWYCTAYVSSICYQIEEVITDSVASAVRQVADSEGQILDKTQMLMILITFLSLIGAALGICNLVTASVMERSQEIGLMKAIGAHNASVTALVLTEIFFTALIGTFVGFFAGLGFAQIIGHTVFQSSISLRPMVIPIVIVLVAFVTLLGCIPAIRMLQSLRPTEVLHGR